MTTFWDDLPRPFFVLAPMEAVTDVIFRHVVRQAASPDLFFTEFTNATGWAHAGEPAIGGRLVKTKNETPIVAHLWGADPDAMAKLAQYAKQLGYSGLDLNTGCPEKSAVKSGGGAGMICNPALTAEVIAAMKTTGLPVSVKCRLGYSRLDEFESWISFLLKQDIVALTVHLRTKKEMSKAQAHWEIMPRIIELRDQIAPHTLIIGNGDVANRQHGLDLIKQTGCDGIMIGRGVFHNPFAFEQKPTEHSQAELLELLEQQLDLYDKYSAQTKRPFDTLKRFFKIYVRGFDGAAELRDKLMHCHSTDEVRQQLQNIPKTS